MSDQEEGNSLASKIQILCSGFKGNIVLGALTYVLVGAYLKLGGRNKEEFFGEIEKAWDESISHLNEREEA